MCKSQKQCLQKEEVKSVNALLLILLALSQKKLLHYKKCSLCKSCLFSIGDTEAYEFIEVRQYTNSELQKPNPFVVFAVREAISKLLYIIPRICQVNNIHLVCSNFILSEINFTPLKCQLHPEVPKKISTIVTSCILYFWCRYLNSILKGTNSKFVKFMKEYKSSNVDPIQLLAYKKYMSLRHKKKGKQST